MDYKSTIMDCNEFLLQKQSIIVDYIGKKIDFSEIKYWIIINFNGLKWITFFKNNRL